MYIIPFPPYLTLSSVQPRPDPQQLPSVWTGEKSPGENDDFKNAVRTWLRLQPKDFFLYSSVKTMGDNIQKNTNSSPFF